MWFMGEDCGEKHGRGEKPTARRITIIKVYINIR